MRPCDITGVRTVSARNRLFSIVSVDRESIESVMEQASVPAYCRFWPPTPMLRQMNSFVELGTQTDLVFRK